MVKLTREEAARIIHEEDALATLRAFPIDEVWAMLDDPDEVTDEEEAFTSS